MDKDWNITIRGVGPHQSEGDTSKDVAALTQEFVQKLSDAGHEVRIADITPGNIRVEPKP